MASDERLRWGWGGVLVLGGLALYARGLGIAYFADDFQYVFEGLAWGVFDPFFEANPHNPFYRPLQSAYLIWVQGAVGYLTWPIHLLQVALHIALSALVFRGGLRIGLSREASVLGAVFMLVSQANVHAVLSNDTLSQVGGALFGYLSLYALYRSLEEEKPPSHRYYLPASLCCFAAALLFKETSVAFFLMAVLIIAFRSTGTRFVQAGRVAAYGVVLALYLLVRTLVVGAPLGSGTGNYALHLGFNVLENAAALVLAATTPVSSAVVYEWVQTGSVGGLLAALAAICAFGGGVAYGLVRLGRSALVGGLVGLAVLSLAPVYALAHVSELYVYNAMPMVALLAGVGLEGGLTEGRARDRFRKGTFVLAVVLCFAAHAASVQEKAASMVDNGERASGLMRQVVRLAEAAPPGATLLLCRGSQEGVSYSVFRMHGFDVLSYAAPVIRARSGRPGLKIVFEQGVQGEEAPGVVALALDTSGSLVRQVPRCP